MRSSRNRRPIPKRKDRLCRLVINVAEVMKPYYNQQPQLVGPKAWRKAEVPWTTPTACKTSSPQKALTLAA